MDELTNPAIDQDIGNLTSQFELYQCYECARAIMQWLADHGIEGKMIELRTRYHDENYIISDRVGNGSIHYDEWQTLWSRSPRTCL